MHDFAGELIASAGSSSASIVTPPNFHCVSLTQGVVPPARRANLRCRFTDNARAQPGTDFALTPISRFKRVIADALRSRTDYRRPTEVAVASQALNRMLELGRPKS